MFHIVILEGLFYISGVGELCVEKETGAKVIVADHLQPMIGERVRFALHHIPPAKIDESKWGGGCCHFQPSECPVGHHNNPAWLLNVSGEGYLQRKYQPNAQGSERGPWRLTQFDGTDLELPLEGLVGHDSRIAVASVLDVEKMREALEGQGVDGLIDQATQLKETIRGFRDHLGKVKP